MIWIIGEYAERIDNAAELLESFLEGFQDENAQVQSFLLVLPGLVMNTYTMFYQLGKKINSGVKIPVLEITHETNEHQP